MTEIIILQAWVIFITLIVCFLFCYRSNKINLDKIYFIKQRLMPFAALFFTLISFFPVSWQKFALLSNDRDFLAR